MSDANSGLACAGPPDILIDQLGRIPSRGNPARLADQFRHDRQYSARHGKRRAASLIAHAAPRVGVETDRRAEQSGCSIGTAAARR
jgi:hypothetical protein